MSTSSTAFIRPAARTAQVRASGAVLVGGGPTDGYRRVHRPAGRPATRPVRPNYAARRLVAALSLLLVVALAVPAVGAIVASLGGAPASAAEVSSTTDSSATHVAVAGDTLWSIAVEHRGDVSHDRYLDALIRLNGGTAIDVGQAVRLP